MISVEFKQVLPFSNQDWPEAFLKLLEDLVREKSDIRLAQQNDTPVDFLVVAYEASEHGRVSEQKLLESCLNNYTRLPGKIVLICCDRSRPQVRPEAVRELAIAQGITFQGDLSSERVLTLDEFGEQLRRQIELRLRASRLMAEPQSADTESERAELANSTVFPAYEESDL